ncbi:alpha/beta fold hydrolase [Phytohabitans flavus]|uniref:Alpha/beta hydrolase n=1 Tax=Phytohabitans flavus TaxID=1076124 RepID=A0A6F8XRX6_9ACTN|nr:alpha/beta fold hydrolase [Phytohabitans flavus]BCB76566.1 alpha/beta hydrolase [Phytohabitans flavus]
MDVPGECHVREVPPEGGGNGRTIVLVHGFMHTGEHYLRTLDGRPGWAYDFAAAGYRVLVPDWPGVGRSAPVDPESWSSASIRAALGRVVERAGGPVDLLVHSMAGPYGIALLESHGDRIAHLVAVAPGQPFDLAAPPDSVEDEGDEIVTVAGGIAVRFPKAGWMVPDRSFVVDKLVGASTRFPAYSPDAYLKTLVPMWSGLARERLAAVQVPYADRPAPAPLPGHRVLVVTGTHDRDHTREADGLVVAWLRGRGAAVDFAYLGDLGITGNSHMLMLDSNSAEVAALVVDWLATGSSRPAG